LPNPVIESIIVNQIFLLFPAKLQKKVMQPIISTSQKTEKHCFDNQQQEKIQQSGFCLVEFIQIK